MSSWNQYYQTESYSEAQTDQTCNKHAQGDLGVTNAHNFEISL